MAIYLGNNKVNLYSGQTSSSVTLQTKSVTPTESAQNVTADVGYDALEQVNVGAISSSYVGSGVPTKGATTYTPSASTQTISSGQYLTGVQTISAIPQGAYDIDIAQAEFYTDSGVRKWRARADMDVWDGWLPSNSYYGPYYVKNAVSSGTSVTPSSSSQTIGGANYMMEGAVTVNPIPSQYIVPTGTKSITANGTGIDVASYASVDVNVSGGGSSKNVQVVQQDTTRITATSYTKACGDITVSKSGTYDVYWTAYRTSSSGTWGTQLYIGSSGYGTAQTAFSNSYFQSIHLSNVSLTANQVVSVYGRSRGSSYYLYVGQLTIKEA